MPVIALLLFANTADCEAQQNTAIRQPVQLVIRSSLLSADRRILVQSLLSKPDLFQARMMFSAPLMRDEQQMIADTRTFLRHHPKTKSFLYCNWGENENQGMERSYNEMKALLTSAAPAGSRWTIERARGADHQQTPVIALPSALYDYFADANRQATAPNNRTERVTSASKSQER